MAQPYNWAAFFTAQAGQHTLSANTKHAATPVLMTVKKEPGGG